MGLYFLIPLSGYFILTRKYTNNQTKNIYQIATILSFLYVLQKTISVLEKLPFWSGKLNFQHRLLSSLTR